MKYWTKILPFLGVVGLIFLAGCQSDETTAPAPPSDVLGFINLGWSYYLAGDDSMAFLTFADALNLSDDEILQAQEDSVLATSDSARAEAVARMNTARVLILNAISGDGWTATQGGFTGDGAMVFDIGLSIIGDLLTMELNYEDSLEMRRLHAEILAGYSFLLQLSANWQQSSEKATALLAMDSTWQFDHDGNIDYLDLRLVRAEDYYFLADYGASLTEALALNDQLEYDPSLGPEDFNLATIPGRAALFQLIQELDDLI